MSISDNEDLLRQAMRIAVLADTIGTEGES